MEAVKKLKIIICDGNKQFCNIFNDYLSNQEDFVVTAVTNDGIRLLKLIQEKKPDLVILDIIMPSLDGLGVLERLHIMDVNPMPHILILSSVKENEIIQKSLILGADRYIVKPVNLGALIKIIKQMFDKSLQSDDVKKALTYNEVLKAKRRVYKRDATVKIISDAAAITDTVEKQNKYKKWVRDQFSAWDVL